MTEKNPKPEPLKRPPSRLRLLATWTTIVVLAGVACSVTFHISIWRASANLETRSHERALSWLKTANALGKLPWVRDSTGEIDFLFAKTYRRLGKFDLVKPKLEAAQTAGWSEPLLKREVLLAFAQTGQYERVAAHWGELFTNAGSDGPEIGNAYVRVSLARFRISEATKVLQSWQQDFPQDAEPYFLQGTILSVQMRWQDAAKSFQAALDLDAGHVEARVGLAESLMKSVKFQAAEVEFSKALRIDPEHLNAKVLRASCLARIDRIEEAELALEAIIKAAPENYDALAELGKLKSKLAQHEQAVTILTKALEIRPEDSQTHYALAQALQAVGRREDAKPHFDFVHEATRPEQQLSQLTGKLVEKAEDPELRYEIGMITWKWRSRAEGLRWFQSVLSLDPTHQKTHLALAAHFDLTGERARADEHRKLAERR